ncbi:MFS transporter [Candidatus Dojkabacteria bacterium]|uniref:MFS transporter n=1 Tax=Candidatus Dojkabacteria bacterium TaxID=2099670 RepID=A0A955L3Q3_9BACT|nr:MFS transporter [Candidatus Dojkabacteria bacterium]
MNKVVKAYITSDTIFWAVNLSMLSFFPLYAEKIFNGDILLATLVVALYPIVRGLVQLPFSKIMDSLKGYNDEKIFMILGIFISTFAIFMLLFNQSSSILIVRQILAGIGDGMFLIASKKQINRHLDKNSVGYEIAIGTTAVLFIGAVALVLAGFISSKFGFYITFFLIAFMNLMAFIPVILVSKDEAIKDLTGESSPVSQDANAPVLETDDTAQ